MYYRRSITIPLLVVSVALAACASQPRPTAPGNTLPANTGSLDAGIHWFRDSAEQRAVYLETYRAAEAAASKLSTGLADGTWGVILDIDETVLDNSEYQKQVSLSGRGFDPDTFGEWVDERKASLIPGAREFADAIRANLRGKIVLITNRSQNQCGPTEDNLRKLAFHYDQILCDEAGAADKNARFQAVINGIPGVTPPLKVLIWVGDNIQDFPSLTQKSPSDFSQFGTRYFVLPNPMYGSWQKNPAR